MQKKGVQKRDNKVFVIGVLIIFLIVMVVMNFGRFTGSTTREKPTTVLTISPDKLNQGDELNIDLIPGNKGTYNQYYICYTYNDVCLARPKFSCSAFKCTQPVSDTYKTWAGWESGVYYVKVFDYGSKEYVKTYFTIE